MKPSPGPTATLSSLQGDRGPVVDFKRFSNKLDTSLDLSQLPIMSTSRPSLQLRAFTSILIGWAFLALPMSGTILFLSPPGRVANWNDWRTGI